MALADNTLRAIVTQVEDNVEKAQNELLETQSPMKQELIASHAFVGKLIEIAQGSDGMNEQEASVVRGAANTVVAKHQLDIEEPSLESLVGTNNALTYCRQIHKDLWKKIVSYK